MYTLVAVPLYSAACSLSENALCPIFILLVSTKLQPSTSFHLVVHYIQCWVFLGKNIQPLFYKSPSFCFSTPNGIWVWNRGWKLWNLCNIKVTYKYRKMCLTSSPPTRWCLVLWHWQFACDWYNLRSYLLCWFPSVVTCGSFLVELLHFPRVPPSVRIDTEHPYHKEAKGSQDCSKPRFFLAWPCYIAILPGAPG